MLENVIGLVSCLLCAFPFFVIGYFNRRSREPIPFWSGDRSLKERIKNVQGYNEEMGKLYCRYALAFVLDGLLFLLHMTPGLIGLGVVCTLGIYLFWKKYKLLLKKYGR